MSDHPLVVLRNHFIAVADQKTSPGIKAVELERALERGGYTILSNEIAALLTHIISRRGISEPMLDTMLCDLGLAEIVAFDPTAHNGGNEDSLPGDKYMKYAPALTSCFDRGLPHLSGKLQ